MKRENCWEVMACGREPGGGNEGLGVCPAAVSGEHDGVNGGKFRGRACWLVTVTFCRGGAESSFAKRMLRCLDCAFLKRVQDEEGRDFFLIAAAPRKR